MHITLYHFDGKGKQSCEAAYRNINAMDSSLEIWL